jgi:hypothetical protein
MNDTGLIRYDAACRALAEAQQIDEAKDIKDKAEALRVYALQAHNPQLEADAWTIRRRAERRMGELSADLDKALPGRGVRGARLPAGGKAKGDALAAAGISTSAAHRYEQIAQMPEPEFEATLAEGRDRIVRGERPEPIKSPDPVQDERDLVQEAREWRKRFQLVRLAYFEAVEEQVARQRDFVKLVDQIGFTPRERAAFLKEYLGTHRFGKNPRYLRQFRSWRDLDDPVVFEQRVFAIYRAILKTWDGPI